MGLFGELLPIIFFFIAYKVKGIMVATAVLMSIMTLVLIVKVLLKQKIDFMFGIAWLLVMLLGGLTLILDNPEYLKIKPTIAYYSLSLIFLGSQYVTKKNMLETMMEKANIQLNEQSWSRLNLHWVSFFIAMGTLNLWVVYNCTEQTWVNFKVMGTLGITFVFVVIETILMTRLSDKIKSKDTAENEPRNTH